MGSIKEKFKEIFFESPQRGKVSLVYFGGAILFLGLQLFREGGLFAMMMCSGFVLTGVSEALPEEQNILSGVLRLTAIAVYITILALSFLQPDILL